MSRVVVAATGCLLLAGPALAQLTHVARPPEPPTALATPAENLRFAEVAGALERKAAVHDPDLSALAADCPRMASSDARAPACKARRDALAQRLKPYFTELRAYREQARTALQARIAQLDRDLASMQNAIRNIGFGATAAAYEQWEELSEDAKDEMTSEAIGSMLTVMGSKEFAEAATAKLGAVFDKHVSTTLKSPLSWNTSNIHAQIREMERLGADNPHFHLLMRKVASAKDKRAYVESSIEVMRYVAQVYKNGKGFYSPATAKDWQRRNWAMASGVLTLLSDSKILKPDRAVKWLGTEAGRKTLGGMKAALSTANLAMHLNLYLDVAIELENMSGLPEQQLKTLEELDDRLKKIVENRNKAKKELARFAS